MRIGWRVGKSPSADARRVSCPHAFDASLDSADDVTLTVAHEDLLAVASRKDFTLSLVADEYGLKISADLPDDGNGRFARDMIRRGACGMSLKFSAETIEFLISAEHGPFQYVTRARLSEVCITDSPVYGATEVHIVA